MDSTATTTTKGKISGIDKAIESLSESFQKITPFEKYVIVSNYQHSYFYHVRKTPTLCEEYQKMQNLRKRKAFLVFKKTCACHLLAASKFLKECEQIGRSNLHLLMKVDNNYASKKNDRAWLEQCRYDIGVQLCEIANTQDHLCHMQVIKAKICEDRWLVNYLPLLVEELENIEKNLQVIRNGIMWWLRKVIETQLQLLGYIDSEEISSVSLHLVFQGLEMFNRLSRRYRRVVFNESQSRIGKYPQWMYEIGNLFTLREVLTLIISRRAFQWYDYMYNRCSGRLFGEGDRKFSHKNEENFMTAGIDRERIFSATIVASVAASTTILKKYRNRRRTDSSLGESSYTSIAAGRQADNGAADNSVHHAPLKKQVSWSDISIDGDGKREIYESYLIILWQRLIRCYHSYCCRLPLISINVKKRNIKNSLCPIVMQSEDLISKVVEILQTPNQIPGTCSSIILRFQSLPLSIHQVFALHRWDTAFVQAVAASLVDRNCRRNIHSDDVNTATCQRFRDTLQVILYALRDNSQAALCLNESDQEKVDYYSSPIFYLNIINPILSRLTVTIACIIQWISKDIGRYFSGWDLTNLITLWKSDLSCLQDDIKNCLDISESLCSSFVSYEFHNWLTDRCTWLLYTIRDNYSILQDLSCNTDRNYRNDLYKLATQMWEQVMPKQKKWRLRHIDDIKPNSYVNTAIETAIKPAVEGLKSTAKENQLSVLTLTTDALMNSWTEHILKEEIKFSIAGARQLQVDFLAVVSYLKDESTGLDEDVRGQVDNLPSVRKSMKIVEILMEQPERDLEKVENVATLEVEEDNARVGSSCSVASSVSSGHGHQGSHALLATVENEIDTIKWKQLRVDRSQNIFQKHVGGILCTKGVSVMN